MRFLSNNFGLALLSLKSLRPKRMPPIPPSRRISAGSRKTGRFGPKLIALTGYLKGVFIDPLKDTDPNDLGTLFSRPALRGG